jgi:hypothetical protein
LPNAPSPSQLGKHGKSHIKAELPLMEIAVIQYLRIEQMGRKKSVPLFHYIAARQFRKF